MYGIFTYMYHKNQPNVGKYTSPMVPLGIDGNICFSPGWSGGDLRSVLDFMVRVNLDARSHQKPKEFLRWEENARGFAGVKGLR